MEILIIGASPPCVRCLRLFQLAKKLVQQIEAGITVRKIPLNSSEAKKYGKVGTAHNIAELAKMTFDTEHIDALARTWSKELDDELMKYKEKAEEMDYLMTPVLIINGQVKTMGFVPEEEEIRHWIQNELS
jgi:hypothetical protein